MRWVFLTYPTWNHTLKVPSSLGTRKFYKLMFHLLWPPSHLDRFPSILVCDEPITTISLIRGGFETVTVTNSDQTVKLGRPLFFFSLLENGPSTAQTCMCGSTLAHDSLLWLALGHFLFGPLGIQNGDARRGGVRFMYQHFRNVCCHPNTMEVNGISFVVFTTTTQKTLQCIFT